MAVEKKVALNGPIPDELARFVIDGTIRLTARETAVLLPLLRLILGYRGASDSGHNGAEQK
jgi:hypothetical protein